MKRLLLTVLPLVLAQTVHAQTATVGDQGVDWTHGYSSLPTGSAPADAYEPADPGPVGYTQSTWNPTTSDQLESLTCAQVNSKTTNYTKAADPVVDGHCYEKKIRITCEPTTIVKADNILGFGIANFGHYHLGTGLFNWDQNTDYTSARNNPSSLCAGGPENATNYIEPLFMEQIASGAIVGHRPQDQEFYYVEGTQDTPSQNTWLRRGHKFIIGGSPTNFNDTSRRATYAAAGLMYPGGPDMPAGMGGYYCTLNKIAGGTVVTVSNTQARLKSESGVAQTTLARYLRGPLGEDPWGGNCTGTQAAPAVIVANLTAPQCWDRTNLQMPDGRAHFWYAGSKADNSVNKACPKTAGGVDYGRVPQLAVKNIYNITGTADYINMYLSSDRMRMATTECPDPAAPCDGVSGGNVPATVNGVFYSRVSLSPCRSTGLDFCNGETLHADYTFGWSNVFDKMERECLGMTVRGVAPVDGPAECDSSQTDRTHVLIYGASPNSALSGGCATILSCYNSTPGNPTGLYMAIPGLVQGNITVEHHH